MEALATCVITCLWQVLTFWVQNIKAETMCNEDQVEQCREAATSNKLSSLQTAGQCFAKQYVQFTHMCTVTNYLPSLDYCCCAVDMKVLCCRYHQGWNNFRCAMSDDTVFTIEDDSLPLEILLSAILVPVVVVVGCVICCVKCWCYRYDDDNEIVYCWSGGFASAKEKKKEKANTQQLCKGFSSNRDEHVPLTCANSSEYKQLPKCAFCNALGGNGGIRPEPSAPPLEASAPCAHDLCGPCGGPPREIVLCDSCRTAQHHSHICACPMPDGPQTVHIHPGHPVLNHNQGPSSRCPMHTACSAMHSTVPSPPCSCSGGGEGTYSDLPPPYNEATHNYNSISETATDAKC